MAQNTQEYLLTDVWRKKKGKKHDWSVRQFTFIQFKSNLEKQTYFDTSEKASTHTAGHGTIRMAMWPRAAG